MINFPGKFFNFVKKIPHFLWQGAAVLGILVFGYFFGFAFAQSPVAPVNTEAQQIQIKNDNYFKLISSYEELSNLYLLQGASVATVLDKNTLLNNPQVAIKALGDIEYMRNKILVQEGRIQELRKSAGFPEENFQKTN